LRAWRSAISDHELCNAVGLLGIDDARHPHLRRQPGHQQLLDAGAHRTHPAQSRQALGHAVGEAPAQHGLHFGQFGVGHARAVFKQLQVRLDGLYRVDKCLGGQRMGQQQGLRSPSATVG
jgi:hypothetical protein